MIGGAFAFVIETLANLFLVALLLRFLMQWTRASFQHPFGQFIIAITDFLVRPVRKAIPGYRGMDWASLLVAYALQTLVVVLLLVLDEFPFMVAEGHVWGGLLLLALASLLRLALYLMIGLVFVQALVSWINPFSPIAPILHALTRPALAPVRRILPPVANVDLSPLAVFLVGEVLIMWPVAGLERLARGLM
jgi:YggT family protein